MKVLLGSLRTQSQVRSFAKVSSTRSFRLSNIVSATLGQALTIMDNAVRVAIVETARSAK
jgi:hypothetical protein